MTHFRGDAEHADVNPIRDSSGLCSLGNNWRRLWDYWII